VGTWWNIWKSSTGNDGLYTFLQMESIGFLLSCTGSSGSICLCRSLFAEPPARFKGKSTENYAVLHGDLIKMSEISEIGFLQGKITYRKLWFITAFKSGNLVNFHAEHSIRKLH
jgi:hypothetical protein